jgi:hypothetical protein
MRKTALISDILFAFFVSGFLSLCLFRYWGAPLFLSFLLALTCGILSACAIAVILIRKRKSFFIKRSDEAQKQRLLTHLALLSDGEKTDFFKNIFDGAKRVSALRLQTEENAYFLRFRFSPVTADEIASISRLKTAKEKILLCDRIDDNAMALSSTLGVRCQTAESVYALVKEKNALPDKFLGEEIPQNKRKRQLKTAFSKSNSKRFLVSGVLILTASLLSPFPYYYLVFGCILLTIAVFVRIFGYRA